MLSTDRVRLEARKTVIGASPAGRVLRLKKSPGLLLRFLASTRLALVVILVLAILTLAGTLISQVPEGIKADPYAYARWLSEASGRYRIWTGLLERLQLFDVFHSLVLRGLLALLALSIVACTTRRWRGIWNTAFHTPVRVPEGFFAHARHQSQLASALEPQAAAERVRQALRGTRYRVKADEREGSVALFGERNRFSRFGTFLTHVSLLLILAGAIAGGLWGFKDPAFVVAEGTTRNLGLGTNISVRLDHFTDEYYVDGPPKDYRSEVVVFDNGREVKRGTIHVNSPLRYHGIAFHQAFYGQAAVMKVQDPAGNVLYEDNVPLAAQSNDGLRPVGNFDIPGSDLTAFVIAPAAGSNDPAIPAGEMRLELFSQDAAAAAPANLVQGTPATIAGMTYTFERESVFSGLKVVKDPGVNIIWVACGLMVLGLVALFYLPPRRIWALSARRPDGTTEVRLAMPAQRDFALDAEFRRLSERIEKALGEAAIPGPGGTSV